MISKEEREKDKAICEAATPGPWEHLGGRMFQCRPNGDSVPARTTADALFMVAARERLPAYIDAAEEMERRIVKIEQLIEDVGPKAHETAGLRFALRILRGEL